MVIRLTLSYMCQLQSFIIYLLMSTCKWQMSGSRIKTAGRFRQCAHIGCFDLETFVQLNQRSRKASDIIRLIFSAT